MHLEADCPARTQEISLRRILKNLRQPGLDGGLRPKPIELSDDELKVAVQQMVKTIRSRGNLKKKDAGDLLLILNMSPNGNIGVKGVKFDAASEIFLSPNVVNGSLLTLKEIEKRYRKPSPKKND